MKARAYNRETKNRLRPKNEIQWVDNPRPDLNQVINFRVPEFSHRCPMTGQPDVAVISIRFIPHKKLLETKSLLQYLWTFRDREIFHEEIGPVVLDDIVKILEPQWAMVKGEFCVRGISWETTVVGYLQPQAGMTVQNLAVLNRFTFDR